jgi:hypothetical protein
MGCPCELCCSLRASTACLKDRHFSTATRFCCSRLCCSPADVSHACRTSDSIKARANSSLTSYSPLPPPLPLSLPPSSGRPNSTALPAKSLGEYTKEEHKLSPSWLIPDKPAGRASSQSPSSPASEYLGFLGLCCARSRGGRLSAPIEWVRLLTWYITPTSLGSELLHRSRCFSSSQNRRRLIISATSPYGGVAQFFSCQRSSSTLLKDCLSDQHP